MNTAELHRLAEDAINEAAAYRRGEGRNPNALAEFQVAASPTAVLALLDEVKRLQNLCLNIGGERDEAREAVRVLVEALEAAYTEEWAPAPPTYGWGELARAALADPRVRRVVEGG